MRMRNILPLLCLSFVAPCVFAQQVDLQPVPQEIVENGGYVVLPGEYRLNGSEDADDYADTALKQLLKGKQEGGDASFQIYIGEKGDKAIKKFSKKIPKHPEGYYLCVDDNQLVLAGNDEQGTYYAVQTLVQLLKNDSLPKVEIKDYPDIRYRGVVEGFYGVPWSFEDRVRQFRFYSKYKMNTYIYGPKDDPYHSSPNWRKPYPEKEAENIRNLVEEAKKNKVDFVWAIHPGKDIQWNTTDRDLLLQKFESMYALGVRSFAVFFDDIKGEGTNPQKQAELLNYVNKHFVEVKKDVTPLIMCPTEYNKGWVKPETGYLSTLGDQLDPSIQIMWTGDHVVTDITKATLEWVNPILKRSAYIWWNFPVTDFARDHIVMGELYGMDQTIRPDEIAAFVSNPMEHAEASKVALLGVASYTWNMEDYDSRKAWAASLKELMPESTDALQVFVNHNSDLGENWHKYRRVESEAIKPVADRFLDSYKQGSFHAADAQALADEYARMVEAADILLVSKDNEALINDIKPWILQFKLIGEMGEEVLAMASAQEKQDDLLFLRKYQHLMALRTQSIEVSLTYNRNEYQPGITTASLVMTPLLQETFRLATEKYNQRKGTTLQTEISYDLKKYKGSMEQAKAEEQED